MMDARRHPRLTCHLPARAEAGHHQVAGVCRNLSAKGMLLRGPLLPVGESVAVRVALPAGPELEVGGEVRYHASFDGEPAMGILFTHMPAPHLAALLAFIG